MSRRLYFLIIIKLLRKGIIFEKKKLNLNQKELKIFFNLYFNLKNNIITSLVFFNNGNSKITSNYTLNKVNQVKDSKNYLRSSLFFFQLKINKLNYSINNLEYIYNLYKTYFLKENIYNSSFFNRFYSNLYFEKKKVLILSHFFLKKNFFKIITFLIESSFLNLKPLLIYDDKENESSEIISDYLKFINNSVKYDYIFICNPFIKLKFLSRLRKLNLPIFSIVDDQISHS